MDEEELLSEIVPYVDEVPKTTHIEKKYTLDAVDMESYYENMGYGFVQYDDDEV